MTPEEYLENTVRRCCTSLDSSKLGNAAIGLLEELGELVFAEEVNEVLAEAGDVCWYVGYFCLLLGIPPRFLGERAPLSASEDLISFACVATRMGAVKKHLYHGHPLDMQRVEEGLSFAVGMVEAILACHGLSIVDAMKHNARKLAARYPNGFSSEASLKRADV